MIVQQSDRSITFAVDDVASPTAPLPEIRAHDAARRALGDIQSCSDYHGTVVSDPHGDYHALLAAVYTAFAHHRPLTLSPDHVWLTITQGIAHHMVLHADRLRGRFVSHTDRLKLRFETDQFVKSSPENPWPDAFEAWNDQIRDHVGAATHDVLRCDFSTTGPVERAAANVVIMDVFERYFRYVVYCICGIPKVTLEGSPDDWSRLADKARALKVFDIDWWLKDLVPICDQFARAARGDVDLPHWRGICKLRKAYGGDIVNGWVARLFPYVREYVDGPCRRRNPIFETGEGFQTVAAPSGLSRVPFEQHWHDRPKPMLMEAVAGFLGVSQDPQTLALRPKTGWAVREVTGLQRALDRLRREHVTHPGVRSLFDTPDDPFSEQLPADLAEFYAATNGADLFPDNPAAHVRILPFESLERRHDPHQSIQHLVFATTNDGTHLSIDVDAPNAFVRLCRYARPWESDPIIAADLADLFERALAAPAAHYWTAADFIPLAEGAARELAGKRRATSP